MCKMQSRLSFCLQTAIPWDCYSIECNIGDTPMFHLPNVADNLIRPLPFWFRQLLQCGNFDF